MIKKIKQLILKFRVYRWNLWFGDADYQIDPDTYEEVMRQYKELKKNGNKTQPVDDDIFAEYTPREVKFCPYCGSKNPPLVGGYYKKHKCYECGSTFL